MTGIKNVLFAVCVLVIFVARAHADDNKKQQEQQQHASAPRSSGPSRPAPSHNISQEHQSMPQQQAPARTHAQAPRQVFHQAAPQQTRAAQPRQWTGQQGPRVYAVPQAAPVQNNTLFHRQHHNHWQPRYNFYDDQYHFYPYVNIASTVELTSTAYLIGFEGQNYYYDQGTFYLQDASGQYVAVAPPIGIIVNPIAPNARQISAGGQMYWRYKGVFYVQVPQGYQVIGPVE